MHHPMTDAPRSPFSPAQSGTLNRDLAWQVAPSLFVSFRYAWAGVRYAFLTQRNFRIHLLVGIVAIALACAASDAGRIGIIGLTTGAVL
ncbi:MAG: diacylglycerol kinase family protein, partial [Leptolyngbyaceae cyanobacterium SM1_3_5]|nr:diacylglycerol kinase family protein [Leptolyngbyaceae cyanobacterium SM1_3_5]